MISTRVNRKQAVNSINPYERGRNISWSSIQSLVHLLIDASSNHFHFHQVSLSLSLSLSIALSTIERHGNERGIARNAVVHVSFTSIIWRSIRFPLEAVHEARSNCNSHGGTASFHVERCSRHKSWKMVHVIKEKMAAARRDNRHCYRINNVSTRFSALPARHTAANHRFRLISANVPRFSFLQRVLEYIDWLVFEILILWHNNAYSVFPLIVINRFMWSFCTFYTFIKYKRKILKLIFPKYFEV